MKQVITILLTTTLLTSCASIERSTLFGGVVGLAAGTGGGLIAEKSAGSALIGAGIGAIIGSAIGYLFHSSNNKKEVSLPNKEDKKKDSKDNSEPSITSPEVHRIWVPEKIEGKKYIEGHYIYVIDKESSWSN